MGFPFPLTNSLKKLRELLTPNGSSRAHLLCLSRKHGARAKSSLFLCSSDSNKASTGLLSLGAKEFENETHRTMGTARGQGLAAC